MTDEPLDRRIADILERNGVPYDDKLAILSAVQSGMADLAAAVAEKERLAEELAALRATQGAVRTPLAYVVGKHGGRKT